MNKLREFVSKWNMSLLTKVMLIILDVVVINVSSVLALLLRFNLQMYEIPMTYVESIQSIWWINTIGTIVIFAFFRLYTSLWRYASIKELIYIGQSCIGSTLMCAGLFYGLYKPIFRSYFILYPLILFLLTCASRFTYRLARLVYRGKVHGQHMRHTMIIGAGEACNVVMKELELSTMLDARIYCVIDDDVRKHGTYIHGVKIIGGRDKILESAHRFGISEIIIAIPSVGKQELSKLVEICQQVPQCEIKILPGVYQLVTGDVSVSKIRNVQIEDLLGREVVDITTEKVGRYISGKVVMVTGGGGSIGSELSRQIAANGVRRLIIFDIYENNAYEIQQELKRKYENLDLVVLIGSVRNGRKLNDVFRKYRPNIVFHAAAHKHVPLMEYSPNEAVKNNVFGTYKTALAADKFGVEKFVLISTDKAVNPTNVMGATKRICEMIIQVFSKRSKTDYVAVRFGNVLGSNGSVIPLFKKQLEQGGPITVTHPDIIRYFMTIPEAVSLVLQAGANAKGGDIFVLDMGEPVKIVDLAKNLIKLSGYTEGTDIEIQYTGLRPGEKLYEELLMSEEGLENTENQQIYIGKPIEFQEEEFLQDLEKLYQEAYSENPHMKEIVHKIVPTYKLREEDKIWETGIDKNWEEVFADENSELPSDFFRHSDTNE